MARQCRFCLETYTEANDKLIEPCVCRGSVQYVHELCLRKWARMDPAENATICSICKQPFNILVLPKKEVIPVHNTVSLIILDRTVLMGSIIQYIVIVSYIRNNYFPIDEMKRALAVFQFIYFVCFRYNQRYENRELYIRGITRGYFPYMYLVHIMLTLRAIFYNDPIHCFTTNIVMNMMWREHIRVLQNINDAE